MFARKLFPLLKLDISPVKNEVRAIQNLCDGKYQNIIEVFNIGEFPDSSPAFIDMESCDMNLDEYNKSSPSKLHKFDVIKQICNGPVFIHSHSEVHRDLKLKNRKALSCRLELIHFSSLLTEGQTLEISILGLTSEGTSQGVHRTEFAKGTPGYRSPKLLVEDHNYNNKVDIRSLGCIFHELIVGKTLFLSDKAVEEHHGSNLTVEHCVESNPDLRVQGPILDAFRDILQKDSSIRPSASILFDRFSS